MELTSRYDAAKKSGNPRCLYQCKLQISVTVGVWEMYKSYAKRSAYLVAYLRRLASDPTYADDLMQDGMHSSLYFDDAADDDVEEFISETVEGEEVDD